MNLEHLHRDLGRLEGQVTALQTKVDAMDAKLTEALKALSERRGASYVYTGAASAVVAFLTAWFTK